MRYAVSSATTRVPTNWSPTGARGTSLPVAQHDRRTGNRCGRRLGRHPQRHLGAFRGVDVAAVGFLPRRHVRKRRIAVRQVDAADPRRFEQGHMELARGLAGHLHLIRKRSRDALEPERERAIGLRLHAGGPRRVLHAHGDIGHQAARGVGRRRAHGEGRRRPHARIAGRDLERQPFGKRPQPHRPPGTPDGLAGRKRDQREQPGRRPRPGRSRRAPCEAGTTSSTSSSDTRRAVSSSSNCARGPSAAGDGRSSIVDRRHQPVVEARHVVLGQARQLPSRWQRALLTPRHHDGGDGRRRRHGDQQCLGRGGVARGEEPHAERAHPDHRDDQRRTGERGSAVPVADAGWPTRR